MKDKKVLSPHLQIYRLPFTALMSISHRITGVILFGLVLLFCFLVGLFAFFPNLFLNNAFATIFEIFRIALILSSLPLLYHLINGIRHLIWDFGGVGLNLKALKTSGVSVLIATLIVFVILILYVYGV